MLKDDGKMALIKVAGFKDAAKDNILNLTKDGFVSLLKLDNKQATPEATYLIPSQKLIDDKDEAWDEVKLYYYDSCSTCHAAHKPKEHLASE